MSVERSIESALVDGLEQLVREGSNPDYWASTRATSDALIAISRILPMGEFVQLKRGAEQDLISKSMLASEGGRNWMEEVWDTSVACIALCSDPVRYAKEINESATWIRSKYLASHSSWNDELWETLCAVNAMNVVTRRIPAAQALKGADFSASADWLLKLRDTPREGLLINWSSTALFVLFAQQAELPGLSEEKRSVLRDAAARSSRVLAEERIARTPDVLWTPETWSNGLVLWALGMSQTNTLSEDVTFKVAKWFADRVSSEELLTEDRAFACLGLYAYLESVTLAGIRLANPRASSTSREIEDARERLKARVAVRLKARITDYTRRPPFLSRTSVAGYYSVNLNERRTNVLLILVTTGLVTYLTWSAQPVEGSWLRWLVLLPISLGALATIAQLANFNLLPTKRSKSEE